MPDIFIISWAYQCISFTPRWVYESWLPIHWGSSVSFYRRTEEFLCNSEYRIYNGDGHISTPINSQIQWILKDWIWCAKSDRTGHTVGINPILNDLNTPGTSRLGWRYFEPNEIDRNELQICKNSQKGTKLEMAEKIERRKIKFQPCSQPMFGC